MLARTLPFCISILITALDFMLSFCPMQVDVPIHILGGDSALITFQGEGYDPKATGESATFREVLSPSVLLGSTKLTVPGQVSPGADMGNMIRPEMCERPPSSPPPSEHPAPCFLNPAATGLFHPASCRLPPYHTTGFALGISQTAPEPADWSFSIISQRTRQLCSPGGQAV